MQCPTVKIKCQPNADNPAGEVIINASDYDPETMTTVEAYEASLTKVAQEALLKQAADVTAPPPAATEETKAAEEPKPEPRIVEAEGKAEGKGGKKGK